VVVTDEMLLGRILTNLVQNALHYTRSGGVLVAARRVMGQFSLEVWDTGPGIRASEVEKIFTPFYRGDAERDSASQNSGLGLWNGREFANLLGGELSVVSRHGRGSVFRLRLPVPMDILKRPVRRAEAEPARGRALIALLTSDSAALIEQQRLVLARGDAHVSFSDPLQMLAYLNVPLNRPSALLIDLSAGPVTADFLVGILSVRYPELPVGVLADDPTDSVAVTVSRQGARVIAKPLLASNLDGFLRVAVGASARAPAVDPAGAVLSSVRAEAPTAVQPKKSGRSAKTAARKPAHPIT
jgi:hypothetical protein